VRKTPSASCLVFCAFCVLSLLGSRAYGQERDQDNEQAKEHPNGIVQDWSHSHVLFPRVGEIHSLIAVQDDPRAQLSWQHSIREDWRRHNGWGHHHDHDRDDDSAQSSLHTDWSIPLGAGGLAKSMFPAKFTFDTTAAPSCANDFIVYTVNATGGAGQPNIVGFNNLYSGVGSGICDPPIVGRPGGAGDDGVSATTIWSYDIHAAGGRVATSPALSLNGTKVAFVETGSGVAHFHVLAGRSGDGVAANLQTVTSAITINTFTPSAPVAGSGTATDLALGAANDTLSSPFVDYPRDTAYIGNDAGVLFRVQNVFCPPPGGCVGGGTPAPNLDGTWGTGGALTIGGTCVGQVTGPVVDGNTGNVFVGCADGKLYGFTSAGAALTGSPLTVGNGLTDGGIVDPPLLDVVRGLIYVVSGNSGGGSQVVVQAKVVATTLSLVATATLAPGGSFNLHKPAFNDNYFTSVTASTWRLYEVAGDSGVPNFKIYGIQFTGAHVMTGGNPVNVDSFGGAGFEFSPVTEFLTTGGEDRFFESLLGNLGGNLASFRIDLGFPAGLENSSSQGTGGTTGIVVDNDASASAQADSIYFGNLSANTAVKLTQGALN
jgi:hypothetical protein